MYRYAIVYFFFASLKYKIMTHKVLMYFLYSYQDILKPGSVSFLSYMMLSCLNLCKISAPTFWYNSQITSFVMQAKMMVANDWICMCLTFSVPCNDSVSSSEPAGPELSFGLGNGAQNPGWRWQPFLLSGSHGAHEGLLLWSGKAWTTTDDVRKPCNAWD